MTPSKVPSADGATNSRSVHLQSSDERDTENTRKYSFNELTSIRGLAAWWIVLYHFREYCSPYFPEKLMQFLDHGYLAVDIFFILSGFVIYLNYAERFQKPSRRTIQDFLFRRLARIYPLHIVMMIAYLSVPLSLTIFRPQSVISDRYSSPDFFLNIALIQNWGLTDQLSWNYPSWSISAEWAAYLMFPLMAAVMWRMAKKPGVALIVGVSSLALLALLYFSSGQTSIGHTVVKLGTLRCVLEFLAGMALCNLYQAKRNKLLSGLALTLATVLATAFCMGAAADYLVIPATIAFFLYAIVGSDGIIAKVLNKRILVYLGEISYSTYMIHALVIQWMKFLIIKENEDMAMIWILIYIAIILGGSHILYRYVERPAQKFLNGHIRRRSQQAFI